MKWCFLELLTKCRLGQGGFDLNYIAIFSDIYKIFITICSEMNV